MTDDLRQRAIALYDAFTHDHCDRRRFMAELTILAGGASAAAALVATIAPDPVAAALTSPEDKRLTTRIIAWPGANGHRLSGYLALPAADGRFPPVMVIHENRGLNDHIRDIARRLALAGFAALAPDFLSPFGGTPADEDAARGKIATLDLFATTEDAVATVKRLQGQSFARAKVGTVGFCWGGGLVDRTAVEAGSALAAAVAYYGPAPDPSEAGKVKAAMLLHYAGLDDRVDATGRPWVTALQAALVPVEAYVYPGVNHAFNNDTGTDRYNKPAADLAWGRTIAFLHKQLS